MKRNELHATWVRTRSFRVVEAAQFKQLTGGAERRQSCAKWIPLGRGSLAPDSALSRAGNPAPLDAVPTFYGRW